jgi:hypothetical protein
MQGKPEDLFDLMLMDTANEGKGVRRMFAALMTNGIDGVAARRMIDTFIEGNKEPYKIVRLATGQLSDKIPGRMKTLGSDLRDRHQILSNREGEINSQVVAAMGPYQEEWHLLQAIPGIDKLRAAMVLVKISTYMSCFGSYLRQLLCQGSYRCTKNQELI